MNRLVEMLVTHEGIQLFPYKDSVGKLTIGTGRNLDDMGITAEEAMYLLKNDVRRVIEELEDNLSFWDSLPVRIKEVLIDMCFNLGLTKFLGFKKMLKAFEKGNYGDAIKEMLDSRWAKQVKGRATDLATIVAKQMEQKNY
jgi:lysozyme